MAMAMEIGERAGYSRSMVRPATVPKRLDQLAGTGFGA